MTSPRDPHSATWSHINGSTDELLDRLAIQEICKGWPVYRDASEWKNFRSLFLDEGAWVWTTWSGPRTVDDFIAISRAGKAAGVFISHRECGTLVELDSARGRAIGKMRATISQRFRQTVPASAEGETPQEFQYDVECDCRFLFFVERVPLTSSPSRGGSQWKTRFVKLIYEKDRVLPADGTAMPDCLRFAQAELAPYPEGYRFLGAAQARLGYPVEHRLPTPRDNETWTAMYAAMESWLAGEKVELHWAGEGERDIENGLGGEGFEMGNESRTTEMSRGADGVSGEQKENCGQEQSKAIAEDGGVAQPTTAAGVKKASIVNGHANGHCADGHTNGNVAVVVPKDVKVEDLAVQTPPVEVN